VRNWLRFDHVFKYTLFFISSNGVPRHCTTSVNRGDTETAAASEPSRRSRDREVVPTVITHGDIRNHFLQDCFPFHEFFVLRLCSLQFCTKFLIIFTTIRVPYELRDSRDWDDPPLTSIFPRWKNLASWPADISLENSSSRCDYAGACVNERLMKVVTLHKHSNMTALRLARSPPLSSSPRSSLDASHHRSINAVLKDLQTCSRRLHAALSTHRDELQILERLYYKGKNQHRSALFWKRVVEVRRYGHRLAEMAMPVVLDRLRSAFFGEKGKEKR